MSVGTSVISGVNDRNAPEAIGWLCQVFGFEKHAVFPGPDNTIAHSELTLGGAETRSVNLAVSNADAVYARAEAAGAEILFDIEDKPQGGRGFTCRDPGGHILNVGTYDPSQAKTQP